MYSTVVLSPMLSYKPRVNSGKTVFSSGEKSDPKQPSVYKLYAQGKIKIHKGNFVKTE